MNFSDKLRNYANLLVEVGLNVQEGQRVQISAEVCHRDLVKLIVERCYEKGALHVDVLLEDPFITRARIEKSNPDALSFVPSYLKMKYDSLVDDVSANLKLIGPEEPDLYDGLDTRKVNSMRLAVREALARFYDEGIGHSKVHWTVAAAASPKWSKKVFPELEEAEAEKALWEQIFHICRADKENCIELWAEHNEKLISRSKQLNDLSIEKLHFTGPGTDLNVFLSEKARFSAGTDKSPRGVFFEANIPTEEVFTSPDRRHTSGFVKATRPFLINGTLIEGLTMTFSNGKIASFSADAGEDAFREYIESDEGASYLGEVALVGIDSPIYQSGKVFQEILYDENAACHIAVGSAYKFCIEGSESMSPTDLEAIGCNESHAHTDMMISSEEVDVHAETRSGERVLLIKNGAWAI